MTVHAGQIPSPTGRREPAAAAEHISLEGDFDYLEERRNLRRKVRSSYLLKSRLRGCETEIAILDEHYASVRSVRPHAAPCSYDLDLRFANPKPVMVRTV